jgi:Domain of unknown function (DUF1918)
VLALFQGQMLATTLMVTAAGEVAMRAQVGDELTVRGTHQGDAERHGQITRVEGADGAPPCVVRWSDGRETVFFPASGTEVTHHPAAQTG